MKIKELIEKLKKYDQELIVSINGYEGGVRDNIYLKIQTVSLNYNDAWYLGEHEEYNKDIPKHKKCRRSKRLLFDRYEK